ncbi:S-layer homology domain-containing protein [Negativicoccus succinicivorans]|nr:S-layer homology domain-containing protein [Negativicoccus succinicivorans]MDU1056544.1 S-layer homology domain-containing protein [Negativicoccus succinicivorans]MDU5288485.1 S-layer homology domain-containing protein [Negativicoccus succinicivorans]
MMNKKLATVLAATCVLGATTAFAAPNPFSDVTPNDWAYQAVSQLAAEGVVEGYPDGTFKGQQNMTRYEMAQMVARALVKQDQLNAEQQAQLNRLADEFANELNSLGVRVSNLEDRVGNVKLTGDARVRWVDNGTDDNFDMRARIQANAKVADNTTVTARISSDNFGFDSKDQDPKLNLDRLYVDHQLSDGLHLTAGRYGETFGATGYWYDDAFDGVRLQYKATDAVNASVGYGYAKGMDLNAAPQVTELKSDLKAAQNALAQAQKEYDAAVADGDQFAIYEANMMLGVRTHDVDLAQEALDKAFNGENDLKSPEMTYGTLGYNGNNFRVIGTYIAPNGNKADAAGLDDIWGAGAVVGLNEDFSLSGDYFNVGYKDHDDAAFWNGRVDFGHTDMKKPGSFNIFVDYVDAEQGSYLGGSGSLRTASYLDNTKSWGAGFGVVVAENVKLEGLRTFNAETQNGADLDDLTKVQLSYKF